MGRLSLRHAKHVEKQNPIVNLKRQMVDIEQLEIDAKFVLRSKQYLEKTKKQNPPPAPGICPICKEETTAWVLDHCHHTDTFRGYMCRTCNAGIGLLHDDIEVLNRAVNYLTK